MKYRVRKKVNLQPMLNINWWVNSFVSDELLDKYFSQGTKEYFILNNIIEPIEETPKPMTAEQFIETYHPERWWKWISAEKRECEDVLNKPHVLELLKRWGKIQRANAIGNKVHETIMGIINNAERER